MHSKNYLGPLTIYFKEEIPDMAKAIPRVEILDDKTIVIPYASTTPRIQSIDFMVNGTPYSLTDKSVQKVEGPTGNVIFGE